MRAGVCSELNGVINVLSKLGLNPVDRAKLNLLPPTNPKDKSEWHALDELD